VATQLTKVPTCLPDFNQNISSTCADFCHAVFIGVKLSDKLLTGKNSIARLSILTCKYLKDKPKARDFCDQADFWRTCKVDF